MTVVRWLTRVVRIDQLVRAAVHQLHQREAAAAVQPHDVRAGAGGISARRHRVEFHRLRSRSAADHWTYREGNVRCAVIAKTFFGYRAVCRRKKFGRGSLKWCADRKRRYRDAEGVKEGWGLGWEGVSSPHLLHTWLRVWGSVMSSPSRVRAAPRPQTLFQHVLSITERFRWKENVILLLNMLTILTTATICWVLKIWGEPFGGRGLIP